MQLPLGALNCAFQALLVCASALFKVFSLKRRAEKGIQSSSRLLEHPF